MIELSYYEKDILSILFYREFQENKPIPMHYKALLEWERQRFLYVCRRREQILSSTKAEIAKLLRRCSLLKENLKK